MLHVLAYLVAVLLLMPLSLAIGWYYGWALSILWQWFMVPYLGLPALPIPQAMGVTTVVHFLVYRLDLKSTEKWPALLAGAALKPPTALLFGWLVKWLFGI